MKYRRVLVQGATGFIGGAVVRRIVSAGHEVTGLASSPDVAGVGSYFNRKGELKSPKLSYDSEAASRLWKASSQLSHSASN